NTAFALFEIFRGEFRRFSKTNNSCDVFRPAASSVFLAAACDQRTKARSPVDIKRAHAFWPMKFVRGKGKKIYRHIAQANRDFPDRLHSVSMKKHTFPATSLSDFLNGKQHAGFIVRP